MGSVVFIIGAPIGHAGALNNVGGIFTETNTKGARAIVSIKQLWYGRKLQKVSIPVLMLGKDVTWYKVSECKS